MRREKREKEKKCRTSRRSIATINSAVLKQKAADYCIDEFNDRASAFIVAQFFTWLISQLLFHAPFATEPSANNYNSSLIDICERDCSRSLLPLFLYIFLSSSFALPLFLVLFFPLFALSPFLSPSLRPTDFTLLFLFFQRFPPMGGVPLPSWQGCQPSNPPPTLKIWPCASHPSRGRARKARVAARHRRSLRSFAS